MEAIKKLQVKPNTFNFEAEINKNTGLKGKAETQETADKLDIKFDNPIHGRRMRDTHDVMHENMEAIHIGVEMAHSAEATGLLGAASMAGGAVSGLYFGIEGVKDMKLAIKEKNLMHGVEATGHLGLAAEAGMELAAHAAESSVGASLLGPIGHAIGHSHALHLLGAGFGVVHGAAEVVIGGKEIYDGIKVNDKKKILSGALNVGIGAAAAAVALGGGIPAGIALGAIFVTKMSLIKPHKFKKAAVDTFKSAKMKFKSLATKLKLRKPDTLRT